MDEWIRALKHRDPEVRRSAAQHLATTGDSRAVPALERMALADRRSILVEGAFTDRDEWVYEDALAALGGIYARVGVSPEDVARMTRLLEAGADYPNGTWRVLAPGGEALRPTLETALSSPEPEVAALAMKALVAMGQEEAAFALLSHPHPKARSAAITLNPAPSGDPWYEAIAARLAVEPDPDLRLALVAAERYWHDPHTLRTLLGRRHDPDVRVRRAAILKARLHGAPHLIAEHFARESDSREAMKDPCGERTENDAPGDDGESAAPNPYSGIVEETRAWAETEPDPDVRKLVTGFLEEMQSALPKKRSRRRAR